MINNSDKSNICMLYDLDNRICNYTKEICGYKGKKKGCVNFKVYKNLIEGLASGNLIINGNNTIEMKVAK